MIDVKKRLLAELLGHVNKGIGTDMKSRYGRKDEETGEAGADDETSELAPDQGESDRPDPLKAIEEIARSIDQSDPVGTPAPVSAEEEFHGSKVEEDSNVETTPDADAPSDAKIEDLDDDELNSLLGRR